MKITTTILALLFATSLCAKPLQLDYVIYDPVGESGNQQIIIDGSSITSSLYQTWNNRVVDYKETTEVDEMGQVISFQVKGTSAFGAQIEEVYRCDAGTASWKSTAESGSTPSDCKTYYLPLDSAGGATMLLNKAAIDKGSVDLLPSGALTATKLNQVELVEGDKRANLTLYAFSGTGFNPSFVWVDEEGLRFATYWSSGGSLRQGWDRKHLETLGEIEKAAEQQYYEELAAKMAVPIESELLLKNVAIVDVKTGVRTEGRDVLLADGKITAIGSNLSSTDARIIDAKGQTLIPGMWEMHGHLSIGQGIMNIAAGVTSVRDIGNEHENIMRVEDLFENNTIIGPTVYRSGFIDKLSPYASKSSKTAESLDEALAHVDWFADRGYGQIKLYSSIEPEWVKPLAERAHARGMRISGHIPAFMTAEEAVKAGYDEIQHMNMLFLNFLEKNIDTRTKLRFTIPGTEGGNLDLTSQEVKDFVALMKEKGTVVDPTITIINYAFNAKAGVSNIAFNDVAAHLPPSIQRGIRQGMLRIEEHEREAYSASAANMNRMIKVLHDAGVQVIPGTDFYNGIAYHSELKSYVAAGISEADVLRLATLDASSVVKAEKMTGSIEVGKAADLVLIDGNPLEDFSVIRRTTLVIKGQQMYQPDRLWQSIGVQPFAKSIEL
ncbi:amidohydrolase [Alteromonas sediminis]|uniref:Amidohydrolase n=1 Tax=Alteromonas sediminis TaxID=2259342 RepID=A0A3N5ZAL5_9ALTE|nr:amidohydrolase family protein [Alteromonas sediminis]RPJ66538.1 amidohydrolase [Alteromonas sediminis]